MMEEECSNSNLSSQLKYYHATRRRKRRKNKNEHEEITPIQATTGHAHSSQPLENACSSRTCRSMSRHAWQHQRHQRHQRHQQRGGRETAWARTRSSSLWVYILVSVLWAYSLRGGAAQEEENDERGRSPTAEAGREEEKQQLSSPAPEGDSDASAAAGVVESFSGRRAATFDACEVELEYSVQYLVRQEDWPRWKQRWFRTRGKTFDASFTLVNNKNVDMSGYEVSFTLPQNNRLQNGTGVDGGDVAFNLTADGLTRVTVSNQTLVPVLNPRESTEVFNFTGVRKLSYDDVYALEDVEVDGLQCVQFPRCDVIAIAGDDDDGEEGGATATAEDTAETERSILGLLRCVRPTCMDYAEGMHSGLVEEEEEDDDGGNGGTTDSNSAPSEAAEGGDESDLDLLTDLVLENANNALENSTVSSCRVQYCCGSQQVPPPIIALQPEYAVGRAIYDDGLASGWRAESANGSFDLASEEEVRSGSTSIRAALGNGGVFRLCTDSPLGGSGGADSDDDDDVGVQFWMYGGKEVGTLELGFDGRDGAASDAEAVVLSTLTSLLVDEWNLFQVPLPPGAEVTCIAIYDSLELEPTFYIDDMYVLLPPLPPGPAAEDAANSFAANQRAAGDASFVGISDGSGGSATTASNSSSSSSNGASCDTGCILGIVFGSAAVVAAAALLIFFASSSRRRNRWFLRRDSPERDSGLKRFSSRQGLLALPPQSSRSFLSNGFSGSVGPYTPSNGVMNVDFEKDVLLEELIGSGGFGSVYKATWRGTEVAVKLMYGVFDSESDSRELENFAQEISVLSRLHHPHIIKFYGACLTPPHVCLIEELAVCSLYTRLHDSTTGTNRNVKGAFGTPLAYPDILVIADEIADALSYMHPSVVHRDLKSQNVLLDKDGHSKMCDFGIAKFKERTFLETKNVQAGTPAYMAPELFRAREASEVVDVFSFGVLLWECFTGRVPWDEYTQLQVIFAVTVEDRRLALPEEMPPFLSELIAECWTEDPGARPHFRDILARIRRERYGDDASCSGIDGPGPGGGGVPFENGEDASDVHDMQVPEGVNTGRKSEALHSGDEEEGGIALETETEMVSCSTSSAKAATLR